jgi:hypothetical protein
LQLCWTLLALQSATLVAKPSVDLHQKRGDESFHNTDKVLAHSWRIFSGGGLIREEAGLCFEPTVSFLQSGIMEGRPVPRGPSAPLSATVWSVLCVGVVDALHERLHRTTYERRTDSLYKVSVRLASGSL